MPPKKRVKVSSTSFVTSSFATSIQTSSDNTVQKRSHLCAGIPVIGAYYIDDSKLEAICKSPKFIEWISKFAERKEINIREFHVTDVDFFGPVAPEKLGFVKGYGVASDAVTNDTVPAIAFIRGGSVAVLIVVHIKETGARYILLCQQLRFPVGGLQTEACAGMLDNRTSSVVGVVFSEVKEETGFIINEADLIHLGQIKPSPGGSDEVIHLYAWETIISQEEFEEKQKNIYGEGVHEKIKLSFIDYDCFDDVLDEIGDVKAECCWRRYLNHKKRVITGNSDEI